MDQKQRLRLVSLAGTLTALIAMLFRYASFPNIRPGNTMETFYVAMVVLLAVNILAAFPGFVLLYQKRVQRSALVSLFGTVEAFLLVYGISPFTLSMGWLVWTITTLLIFVASYILGDFLMNGVKLNVYTKYGIACLIFVITTLVSYYAPGLVY